MDIFYGICYEGGGVSGAIKVFQKIFFLNHLESLPDCQNASCK